MNFGKAFSFPFEDQDWLMKILIPGLVGLIPFIGQLVMVGWAMEIGRRVIRQDPRPLPSIEFGEQLILGLKSFVIAFVYSLPAFLIYLPIPLVTVFLSGSSGDSSSSTPGWVMIPIVCCTGLLILYGLLIMVLVPAAEGRFLAQDRLSAAFEVGKVFRALRAAPGAYVMVALGSILSSIIASLGTIACGVGIIFTATYAMAINSHLIGQAYLEAGENAAY